MGDQENLTGGSGQDGQQEENRAQIDYDQGKSFVGKGDLTLAAAAFHNALLEYEEQNDEPGIAKASDQLGDVCVGRDEQQKALDHYQRAFEICDRLNDPFSLLLLKKKMASCLVALRKDDEAITVYMDMLDDYLRNNNPAGAVETLEKMAEIHQAAGSKQKAADALRTAADIHANFKHARQAEILRKKADQLLAGG